MHRVSKCSLWRSYEEGRRPLIARTEAFNVLISLNSLEKYQFTPNSDANTLTLMSLIT